jgi:hypothetical protein
VRSRSVVARASSSPGGAARRAGPARSGGRGARSAGRALRPGQPRAAVTARHLTDCRGRMRQQAATAAGCASGRLTPASIADTTAQRDSNRRLRRGDPEPETSGASSLSLGLDTRKLAGGPDGSELSHRSMVSATRFPARACLRGEGGGARSGRAAAQREIAGVELLSSATGLHPLDGRPPRGGRFPAGRYTREGSCLEVTSGAASPHRRSCPCWPAGLPISCSTPTR